MKTYSAADTETLALSAISEVELHIRKADRLCCLRIALSAVRSVL